MRKCLERLVSTLVHRGGRRGAFGICFVFLPVRVGKVLELPRKYITTKVVYQATNMYEGNIIAKIILASLPSNKEESAEGYSLLLYLEN